MPLEIRQVVIRAEVEPQKGQAEARPSPGEGRSGLQHEDFVQEIIDQVLRVIDDRKER